MTNAICSRVCALTNVDGDAPLSFAEEPLSLCIAAHAARTTQWRCAKNEKTSSRKSQRNAYAHGVHSALS